MQFFRQQVVDRGGGGAKCPLPPPAPQKKKERKKEKEKRRAKRDRQKKVKRRGNRSFAINPANNVWRRVGAEMTLPPPPPPIKPKRERRKGRERERGEKGKEKKRNKKGRGDQLRFFRQQSVDRGGGGAGHWRIDRGRGLGGNKI